jgi:hypothetical protein
LGVCWCLLMGVCVMHVGSYDDDLYVGDDDLLWVVVMMCVDNDDAGKGE